MVAPLSEVPKEGSSVFSLFSLIKLHLASLPLASSYSHVAVSSVFCAQNIFFSAQTRGAPSTPLGMNNIKSSNSINTINASSIVWNVYDDGAGLREYCMYK